MKDFPIPVVAFGPGSQVEDETLEYMDMPKGMDTYRPPVLPEPEAIAERAGAHRALRETLAALGATRADGLPRRVSLLGFGAADLALVNQVMGEGEVGARVTPAAEGGAELRVQESVFAGVWRVMRLQGGALVEDYLEVGPVPSALREAAMEDVAARRLPPLPAPLPEGVMNAPMLLNEIEDHWHDWKPGQAPRVVNLTLLPMGVPDISFLDHQLGTGRVLILSRGYGNCRITNTRMPQCWRVVYYNSQDTVILNTVEVIDMPEVACAAREDLEDSHERLAEVLQWVDGALAPQEAAA
ncbi:MAG: hydrogenase expression/formation protein [Burkholderiales bacterium]|nr:hydrogenase expression/formation protein [Burkholderiales bacterium]